VSRGKVVGKLQGKDFERDWRDDIDARLRKVEDLTSHAVSVGGSLTREMDQVKDSLEKIWHHKVSWWVTIKRWLHERTEI
jgi:hypothetical protein